MPAQAPHLAADQVSNSEAFLTVAQVANLVGITRPTVYAMLAEGSLRCVRFRSAIRVPKSELDRYVRQRVGSGAEPLEHLRTRGVET
ncbi:MAG TPA: helix-turn-helix domain-containing protein [Microbacteriaceae bacterium]|jgi:excisionase family DNA binding protein|nr:helix-turn-helix domain-containing protein [Microbacteriaceae bacterium]